ncbi:Listeria/Bacterioides repeat-containing protein, partial [Anaerosphaera aminiphila DSM 21120]
KVDAIDKINKVTPKTEAEELADAKAKAKAEIDQAAKDRTAAIEGMNNVSQEAKDEAKAKVEEERAAGNKAVDEATTVENVETEKTTAIDKINKVTPETGEKDLAEAKEEAKEEIDKAAEDKIKEIEGNTDASDKEKEDAISKVEEEQEKGKTAVDNAGTEEEVTKEKEEAIENIENVTPETGEKDLAEAKEDAKKEIDKAAEDKIAEIEANPDASDKEKEDAISKVEEEQTAGNKAVEDATTIAEVGTAKDTAITEINKVTPKTEAEELADAKAKAKAEIDQAAADKIKEIEDRTDISEKSKEDAISKVEEEQEKGKTAVDNAGTEEEVTKEKEEAIDNINKVTPGVETPEEVTYKVNYDGNGARGTAPFDSNKYNDGDNVIVLGRNSLEKSDYTFKGWSTSKYATRGEYQLGDAFTIRENTTLYAIWEKDSSGGDFGFTGGWTSSKPSIETTQVSTIPSTTKQAYIKGYEDGTFRPKENMTRAEVAAIFTRLKTNGAEPNVTSNLAYSDVNSTDWYAKYVGYVTENNLMKGYEDGTFRPEEKITRAEFVTAIARYNSLTSADNSFADANGHWAEGYIGAVTTKSWIKGYPDETFKPDNNISREEVVVIINRMENIDVEKSSSNVVNPFKDVDESLWSYKDIIAATSSKN